MQTSSLQPKQNTTKPLRKPGFNDLLKKYELNKVKYQKMLQKSVCFNSSKIAKTEKSQNYILLQDHLNGINHSYEIDKDQMDEGFRSLKNILHQNDTGEFNKNIITTGNKNKNVWEEELGITYVEEINKVKINENKIQSKNKNLSINPNTQAFSFKKCIESNDVIQKRRTFCPKQRFNGNLTPKSAHYNFDKNKNQNLSLSNDFLITNKDFNQTKLSTKRKFKEVYSSVKVSQIRQKDSICSSLIRSKNPQKWIEIEQSQRQYSNLQKTRKHFNYINQQLISSNTTLKSLVSILQSQLKTSQQKYIKSQQTNHSLSQSLNFQKTSYSTLFMHHNNQVQLLRKQIKQLKQNEIKMAQNCEKKTELLDRCNVQNSKLVQSIKLKDKQIEESKFQCMLKTQMHTNTIKQLQNQIKHVNRVLNENKEILDQKSIQHNKYTQAIQDSKINKIIITELNNKILQLEQHIKISNQTLNSPNSHQQIEKYCRQLFQKYQKSCEQLSLIKGNLLKYQTQLRSYQKIVSQIKHQIEYKQYTLNQIKGEQQQIIKKLMSTEKMLEIVNNQLISKEMQFGNYKYQQQQIVDNLKENNVQLRQEMERILQRVQLLENKIECGQFDSSQEQEEDSFIQYQFKPIGRKIREIQA